MSQKPPAQSHPATRPGLSSLGSTSSKPAPKHPKHIVVFIDGIWNDKDRPEEKETNVFVLSRLLLPEDKKGREQIPLYQPGIGTISKNDKLMQLVSHTVGADFGEGIQENIILAYRSICEEFKKGDEISLVGFSRGAYIARCLSDLIGYVGILPYNQTHKTTWNGEVVALFKQWKDADRKREPPTCLPGPAGRRITGVGIHVCAVFDTVSSVGPRMLQNYFDANWNYKIIGVHLHPRVRLGLQALALREQRRNFHPWVWPTKEGQEIYQCWFDGVHPEVGGGSIERNIHAHASLLWMVDNLASRTDIKIARRELKDYTAISHEMAAEGFRTGGEGSLGRLRNLSASFSYNQSIHISLRLYKEYLFLKKRPPLLDEIFSADSPIRPKNHYTWVTAQMRMVIPEDKPFDLALLKYLYDNDNESVGIQKLPGPSKIGQEWLKQRGRLPQTNESHDKERGTTSNSKGKGTPAPEHGGSQGATQSGARRG